MSGKSLLEVDGFEVQLSFIAHYTSAYRWKSRMIISLGTRALVLGGGLADGWFWEVGET